MRNLILVSSLVLLVSCAGHVVVGKHVDAMGRSLVTGTGYDTYAVSSADVFAKYSQVYFAPLKIDQLKINTKRLDFGEKEWKVTDKERAKISQIFSKKIDRIFSGYDVLKYVTSPGIDAISVEFEFVEFTPNASKYDSSNRGGRDVVFTRGAGDLEVKVIIKDSLAGTILAELSDVEEVGDFMELVRNDRSNNMRHLKNSIEEMLKNLRVSFSELK